MKLISADDLKKRLNTLCAYGGIRSTTLKDITDIIDELPDMADLTEDKHEDKNAGTHRLIDGINDNYIIRLC